MRVSQEPGFVLHQYNYRETSQILEIFTRDHGRISVLAKGARRPKKKSGRHYVRPFQQYRFSWSGRGELPAMIGAEEVAPSVELSGNAIYCGFYINELLMRMVHKHDPHERLFGIYSESMQRLAVGRNLEASLRLFEKYLLLESGYALNLEHEGDTANPLQAHAIYRYLPDQGPVPVSASEDTSRYVTVRGRSLIAYNNDQLDNPEILKEVKQLMRNVIDHMLGFRPLASRRMFAAGRLPKRS
jgi:DNA repair protein RecO (recombination protein O)